jgi:hypothetical protein
MATFRVKAKDLPKKIFDLPTGELHRIIVLARALSVLDVEDSHFNFDRRVMLPDLNTTDGSEPVLDTRRVTGLGVIFAAITHAQKHPEQGVCVTGHTDASGSVGYNQELSEDRAKNVSLLLRGKRDEWRKHAAAEDNTDDIQTVLTWQHQRTDWGCDPGPINNVMNTKTQKAIRIFQERYNQEVDAQAGNDTPFRAKIGVTMPVGPETWGAFYDVYMTELIDLLDLDGFSELEAMQAALKVPPGMQDFVGCGEHIPFNPARRNPFDKGTDEHLEGPQKNPPDRRVEILFFDPGEEVDQVCHPKPGKCVPADCPIYSKDPFKQNPIGIPKGLPVAEVNLKLVFKDPEGKLRPFPEGLEVEAKFGDPTGEASASDDLLDPTDLEDAGEAAEPAPEPTFGGADPDAESMAVDQEPNEKTKPGGLLDFVVPRKGSSMFLKFFPNDRNFITADPKNLADQKLATQDEALADVAKGRVFFQLPKTFTSQEGYFKAPDGVKFDDGQFRDMDNRETQIGSRESPVELVLEVHWQHFKFEFFDRWTSSPTTLPQPRSKAADGSDIPPVVMEGMVFLFDPNVKPDPVVRTAWDVKVGKDTLHCLGWPRRLVASATEKRELPDDKCTVRFETTDLFVRTEGDGKSPDAARKFVVVPTGDATLTTVTAQRLRLYDVPRDWRSTDYPVRLGGEGIDKNRPFQKAVTTPSTHDKPYIVSLDAIVLEDDLGGPDTTLVWDDTKIENRFAIYDNQIKVYKPDPASGEPYFTKLGSLLKKPEGALLHDFPRFTRLIARGVILYDVFERRTPTGFMFKGSPIGARLGTRIPDLVTQGNVTLSASVYGAFHPNSTQPPPPLGDLGESISAVLRCCGHDGDVELFNVIQYVSVNFDFAPPNTAARPHPPGAVPLTAPPADAVNRVRDCLMKVADRWNGRDSVNGDPATFEVGNPVKARGNYLALLTRGRRGAGSIQSGEIRIDVFRTVRAFMRGAQGTWELNDLKPNGNAFVAAHEFGHVFSLPDEYLNRDNEPSMNQPNTGERQRSPGVPYGLDSDAMMNENVEVRARYFWDLMLFARANGYFTDANRITVRRGPRRFTTAITARDQSRVRTAIAPFSLNAAVGPRGLCDRFLYVTGRDEFTAGGLGGSSLANPFDGFIVIRVKMSWNVTTTSDFGKLRSIFARANRVIHRSFNVNRRLIVRGTFSGSPVRLRVLFAPRFLCRTFPGGTGSAQYLANDLRPPLTTQPAYNTEVTRLETVRDGIHAVVRLTTGGTPGVSSAASPRPALVREDGTTLIIFPDPNFEDDLIRVFSQLVGLANEDVKSANDFRPLVTGLPNLVVATLELLT